MGGIKTGKKKLFYLSELVIETIENFALRTGKTQSRVVSELITLGSDQFCKKYSLGSEEDQPEKKEDGTTQNKTPGEQIEEAYMKKVLFDLDHEIGWTQV